MLTRVVTLAARIFGKAVVDAFSNSPSLSKLTVLFNNNVELRIVVSVLAVVVLSFGIAVVFLMTGGKVEDIAVVRIFAVTLLNAVVVV